MHRQKIVETVDSKALQIDWTKQVNVCQSYDRYWKHILTVLRKMDFMPDGRLCWIAIAKDHIELTSPDIRSINFAPYPARPEAREFKNTEIDKMLEMNVNELAQLEWDSPIMFALKKDRSLRICVYYRKLDTVTVKNACKIASMHESIGSLGENDIFLTCDDHSGYWHI